MMSKILILAFLGLFSSDVEKEVDQLHQNSIALLDSDVDEARNIAQKAYEISVQNQFDWGKAHSLFIMAYCDDDKNQLNKAVPEYLKALEGYEKVETKRSRLNQAKIYKNLGIIFDAHYKYPDAINFYKKGYSIASDYKDIALMKKILHSMAIAYRHSGDLVKAAEIQFEKLSLDGDDPKEDIEAYNQLGLIHKDLGDYDEARGYYEHILALEKNKKVSSFRAYAYHNIATCYRLENQFKIAEQMYFNAIGELKSTEEESDLFNSYLDLTELYIQVQDYENAKIYGTLASEISDGILITIENNKINHYLSQIYFATNQPEKAKIYSDKYVEQMEALYDRQKDLAIKADQAKIDQITQEYFNQQQQEEQVNYFIPAVVASSSLLLFLVGQLIRRRRQAIVEAKNRVLNLELTALRSQINPHFLFNAINSIKSFIHSSNTSAAEEYLSDFSKLMRYTLENSDKMIITIEEEVKNLEMYIKMEQLRTGFKFGYQIELDPEIDQFITYIPAMIIQPFVENAIWHGLVPQEEQGELVLSIHKHNGQIRLMVKDNGVGLSKSAQRPNHQSMGMRLITERIALLKKYFRQAFEINIVSNQPQTPGTLVTITVPDNLL